MDLFCEYYLLFFVLFLYLIFICYYMGGIIIVDMCFILSSNEILWIELKQKFEIFFCDNL